MRIDKTIYNFMTKFFLGFKDEFKKNRVVKMINEMLIDFGGLILFTGEVLKQFVTPPYVGKELLNQCYKIGNKSFVLVSITGFIMGLVLTMQTRPILIMFGAQSLIPSMVSISVFREIGPVVTGLICAGKVSSGIGAEIGAMKVTEQIDAMEVSGTKPLSYVVATRVMASIIMVPLLVFFSEALSLFGSFLAINLSEPMSLRLYIINAFEYLDFIDVLPSIIKSVFFGFFIGIIGTWKGYQAGLGTESVGNAANSAVVAASFAIFIVDLVAVLVTNMIMNL